MAFTRYLVTRDAQRRKKEEASMHLNGNRLKEAARLRKLSRDELCRKSGLNAKNIRYYWNNAVTVTNQDDLDAIAQALGLNGDVLLLQGEPDVVALRSDKFSTEDDE
jgi:transcriptional regulator with XRE-family HTH domain